MNEKSLAYSDHVVDLALPMNAERITVARVDLDVVDSLLHPQAILIRKVLTRSGSMDLNLILIDDEENIHSQARKGTDS